MNIRYYSNCKQPRADVWCMSSDLTDNNDGTYTFKDSAIASTLGTGSKIVVMDMPTIVLYYSAETELAYDWTTASGNDQG